MLREEKQFEENVVRRKRFMKIILNGSETEIEGGMRLPELIASKGLDHGRIVVEYNGQIVKKDDREAVVIKENDRIEILRFVGGG